MDQNNNSFQSREEQISEIPPLCDESRSRLKQLEQIIYEMISKSVKELCFEYRYEKKNNPSSDDDDALRPKLFVSIQRPDEADIDDLALALTDERKQLGRRLKNPVTGEKVVCFDIPEDFDVEGIQNIEEIKDRLGKWRIQRRQRDSKMNDTYYCHLASRHTFRSMQEVLNFIMHGPHQKKRSATHIASTSQGEPKSPSKRQKKDAKGKQVMTSQESSSSPSSSETTTISNLELSIVPWTPLESEMNMYCCHLSLRQKIQWRPQPLSIIIDLTEDHSDEEGRNSNSESADKVTQDKDENSILSEPPSLKNLEGVNLLEMFDEYDNILGDTTFEDLVGESNGYGGNTPRNQIGQEMQALIRTEPLESVTIIERSNNKQNQNLPENCGPAEKFGTLEEAKQKLARVELEGVNDDDDHFQHGVYFSKPDPVNHILDYDYEYNDAIDFLFKD